MCCSCSIKSSTQTTKCRQIADVLFEKHGMERNVADECTGNYLRAFRKCPDNPSMSLEQWRTELWQRALPEQFGHLTYDIYNQWINLRYHYMQLSDGLVNMLRQLRKNYLLAVITNGPSNAQWEKIHKLGLNNRSLFDCILVSADLPFEKPDPEIFMTACNYLRVPPESCIMIGDKLETDIKVRIFNTCDQFHEISTRDVSLISTLTRCAIDLFQISTFLKNLLTKI